MAEIIPLVMTAPVALAHIQELAKDSNRIVLTRHAIERGKERNITRKQFETCLRTGYIDEGPFLNDFRNWQVTMVGYYAGEEITVVVAIEWASQLVVVTLI